MSRNFEVETEDSWKYSDIWINGTLKRNRDVVELLNKLHGRTIILNQALQDCEDNYMNGILSLLDKNIKGKSEQEGILLGNVYDDKINVLLELLELTGNEDVIVDFCEKMNDL